MSGRTPDAQRHIVFVSSNGMWGGSEELWSRAALRLIDAGHSVAAFKPRVDPRDRQVRTLEQAGCPVIDLLGPRIMPRKVRTLVLLLWSLSRRIAERRLVAGFRRRPDLVVVSQGLNYDGWYVGILCRKLGIPYVLISQKASDLYWPHDNLREELATSYAHAIAALFVSEHNHRLTEQQIGASIPTARIVRNPFQVADPLDPAWPDETQGLHLACVARLDAREKGQDMLLRVLARPHWRGRALTVTFYGDGQNATGLREMARALGLDKVAFAGHTLAPGDVWRTHHALLLPSRCEGLPLSIIEAMLSGRPVVTTPVGGNAEAVLDDETGFIATAASEDAIDAAMERAWVRRRDWSTMGTVGAARARAIIGTDPVGDFVVDLLKLIDAGHQANA